METIRYSEDKPGRKDIASLHAAFKKLRIEVAPEEVSRGELGKTTEAAIRAFQRRVGLAVDGSLSPETVDRLNVELEHVFYTGSKTRTQKIQGMFQRLGYEIDADEVKGRTFGASTEKALKAFQNKEGLTQDGLFNQDVFGRLERGALKARLATKTQVGKLQRTLLRAARIAKLEVHIDPNELKQKKLGATSQAAIGAFQKKYNLEATGELDPITYERLLSVAASRPIPVKTLKVKSAIHLSPVNHVLRLNMTNKYVGELQQTLAFLGFKIAEQEFKTKTFGKTTREAVVAYQRKHGLPVTGHAEGATLDKLNEDIQQANPRAFELEYPFRIKGSVRDDLGRGQAGVRVQVWEKALRDQGKLLAERRTLHNGFFDVPYDPPRNPVDGQIKIPFHLQIKVLGQNNHELHCKVLFNPTLIAWVNFVDGDEPYRGPSEYERRMKAITQVLGDVALSEVEETDQRQEITHIALNSGLSQEDVMRLALSHRAALKLDDPAITPQVFYAFIGQNLPPNLPSDLLGSTEEWALIEQLVDQTVNGLVFMDGDLQAQAFDNALKENLIPVATSKRKDQIMAALSALKRDFALEKPILIGNGSLKSLLDASDIDQQHYDEIASTFLQYKGLGTDFWADVKARPDDFGGAAAVKDLETTVNLGQVTKNHVVTLSFLKSKIDDPAADRIQSARDLAKLTHGDWVALIQENGGAVPEGTDGNTPQEKIDVYAGILAAQSERLFPAVAFAAEAGRSAQHNLIQVAEIQKLLDEQPDLDLRAANLDKYVVDKQIAVAEDVLAEARVMQRVHRIAPNAAVGRALLEEKIHHSAGIVSLGKERFVSTMEGKGIDRRTALTVYGYAEFQYAQVLTRLADYRFELHRADPRAIVQYTYTEEEQQEFLGGIPNLKVLFGSQDFCDCPHCQSVYSPSAYLADVLRFLESHLAERAGKTVRDILFERRPDIGNVKLNCDNTDTPLPYIDLVCEILENAVPAPNSNPDFSFQTGRTKEELRAFPENVRTEAYDLVKTANYPMDAALNLWQEEARVFLQHFGVPRYELMEAFQARPEGGTPSPADASIAGEFWGLSTHETDIVVTRRNTTSQQDAYWGFDTTRAKVVVSEFMEHAKLEYPDLLDLLYVRWINPAGAADNLIIERPVDSCSTDAQKLANLDADKYDQVHRFLRLWRRTGWNMWELDLLIRAARVGNAKIDADALVRFKQFKQVQDKLGLAFEPALSFYHQINTEERVKPAQPQTKIQPLYIGLFQNPAITNPLNDKFAWPLPGTEPLTDHKATLLAAFAITEADLALLLEKTDGKLNLANLTLIHNHVRLAKGLRISIKDLLALQNLSGETDPFASPRETLDLIELHEWVKGSGFQIQELDYLLDYRPDSPYGLREEVITQYIQSLRESLRSSSPDQKQGQITSQVATTFSLTDEQAKSLLTGIDFQGTLMQHLEDARLTEKDSDDQYITDITPGNFPKIYNAYRLLHKASMLVKRLQIAQKDDLEWLLTHHGTFKTLDFSALPVSGAPAQPLFRAWLALHKWLYFKALYPEPEDISLRQIYDLAANQATTKAEILDAISALTTWKVEDLDALHSGWNLQQGATSDYTDVDTYICLWKCFKHIKRVGVEAGMLLAWAKRDDDTDGRQFETARQIRQAAKSKYDYDVWLSKVTPLQDELREKKRDALAGYLIEHSLRTEPKTITFRGKGYANPRYWKDANDLLSYFLIDVEMSACQLTSRIKQAISSVQMFVQRCFLGLEQPDVEVSREEKEDTVSLNSWKQWKWMKSYRIWEANRKVFLYPENWIEPELRDDKSPFFEELENEILQNEITHENVETAFLHYLQKVHEVSRLEIAGVYHEVDDDNPYDNLPPNINVLHVVGRTRSHPAVYYYRQFDLSYNTWTAWEKIDLDITGDHVIPVVYNRKLYLFWLIFTEKPQKVKKQPPAKASDAPTDSAEPPKMLEIQLAWSARQKGGWLSQKVSQQKLIHPWERPLYSYNLKSRYKGRENLLWLDIHISTSLQFNNTRFYDPYAGERAYVTATRYSETLRPWHSSSFVFDGDVVDLKLKALAGQYRVLDSNGIASEALVPTDSYRYVHDSFGEEGRATNRMEGKYEIAPRLMLPDGMHYHNTHLVNNKRTPNANRLNILEYGAPKTLLTGAKSPFELVFSQHRIRFDTATWGRAPFVYQDQYRAFFIKPEWQELILGYGQTLQSLQYTFYSFYHAYTALFIRELNRSGLEGLLNRRIQRFPQSYYPGNNFSFKTSYGPTNSSAADATTEQDIVDFSRYGAYSIYNWEIFFHAPLMIACKLSQNQRFEEAMRWFHYIFDPTSTDALGVPQRYWITKPFFEQNSEDYRKQRIEKLLANIGDNLEQVRAWKNDPFKPHLIARYRPVAYQKAVVIKYIDNLIAWGDQLFRRDSIESINEATVLYVLAYELLGPRPVQVPNVQHADRSYNDLVANGDLDPFGNKRVEVLMENFTETPVQVIRTSEGSEPLPRMDVFYFCIPNNEKLLGYWTTVEDRLFKIRHCMNIEGVVRQLPLFEPPIEPGLLVKAAAAGVDLSSVLSPAAVPQGQYRFRTLASKAAEFCGEVRALGDKLLSALEKRDAEGLALLRSAHEVRLLEAVKAVRKEQIQEAKETWAGLEKARELSEERKDFYENREFMSVLETVSAVLSGGSILISGILTMSEFIAAMFHLAPSFTMGISGFGGSPQVTVQWGTENIARSIQSVNSAMQHLGSALSQSSSLVGTIASYERRQQDWDLQARLANIEIEQMDRQIEAARIRYLIAEKELENQELQIEQAQSVDEYMHTKYTNEQLYDWMLKQVATVYFQSYQLAYDMAKRAQKCFQFELGKPDTSFIQFGYWDSLKKGLLAGERLANDIRSMEVAYFDRHKRELEITKRVSLAQFMPLSLLALKETGACTMVLPEWLFDMDYPGHYRRRIKSVSITIPCVVGPYTSVNCTLSLINNGIRISDDVTAGYGDPLTANDTRFVRNPVPIQSIATSHGQNDAGMFELNFSDERYLPFEGAGAVSEWRISLPPKSNQFDFATISDVILHIRYTAVAATSTELANAARAHLDTVLPASGVRFFVLNHEFGSEWHRFLHPEADSDQILAFTLRAEHLPFYARHPKDLSALDLIVDSAHNGSFDVKLQLPGADSPLDEPLTADPDPGLGGAHHMQKGNIPPMTPVLGEWKIQLKKDTDPTFRSLQPEDVQNAYLVIGYSIQ